MNLGKHLYDSLMLPLNSLWKL